jgi:DNA-binding NarL/FixJ family response regulator
VVIVDDQELIRGGFEMILGSQEDIEIVGVAANGRDAVELVSRTLPDVALMDIRMPEMDGLEATRVIVDNERLATRVLMLTTFDIDEYVYEAIRAGASGFLLKDSPTDELLRAVRLVAQGDALLAPSVTRTLIEEFARSEPVEPVVPTDAVESLTEREAEVWGLMAQGLSNQEIASALILGEATIKTHVSRVLTKLGVRDRVQAVVAAYESGVVRPGESS